MQRSFKYRLFTTKSQEIAQPETLVAFWDVSPKDRVGGEVRPVRVKVDRGTTADGTNAKYCKILDRADGYGHGWRPALSPRPQRRGFRRGGL